MEHVSPITSPVKLENGGTGQAAPKERTLRYKPGDLIIKEGDFGTALYRIRSGTVGVFKELHGEELPMYELGPGDVFGEKVFIDGGSQPRPASAVAKDAVELEAWHYLALRREHQALRPILRLMALDMVKKLAKISAMHDRLRLDKNHAQHRPAETDTAAVNLKVHEPSCTFKLAGSAPVGKIWEGLVEYRLTDNPESGMLHATGVDIDKDGMRFDVKLANINNGGHEPGSIMEMTIHLAGGVPVGVCGEITSISRGSLIGHTALRVLFRDVSDRARQRITAFLNS